MTVRSSPVRDRGGDLTKMRPRCFSQSRRPGVWSPIARTTRALRAGDTRLDVNDGAIARADYKDRLVEMRISFVNAQRQAGSLSARFRLE
jgi:hypothetical protein